MKRFALSLIYAVGGYLIAVLAGHFLIGQFSTNTHDRAAEAAMTSALVVGPLGAVAAFVVGFVRSGRRRATAIVEGFEAARSRGEDRALVAGLWVEVPSYRNAKRLIERARRRNAQCT